MSRNKQMLPRRSFCAFYKHCFGSPCGLYSDCFNIDFILILFKPLSFSFKTLLIIFFLGWKVLSPGTVTFLLFCVEHGSTEKMESMPTQKSMQTLWQEEGHVCHPTIHIMWITPWCIMMLKPPVITVSSTSWGQSTLLIKLNVRLVSYNPQTFLHLLTNYVFYFE